MVLSEFMVFLYDLMAIFYSSDRTLSRHTKCLESYLTQSVPIPIEVWAHNLALMPYITLSSFWSYLSFKWISYRKYSQNNLGQNLFPKVNEVSVPSNTYSPRAYIFWTKTETRNGNLGDGTVFKIRLQFNNSRAANKNKWLRKRLHKGQMDGQMDGLRRLQYPLCFIKKTQKTWE